MLKKTSDNQDYTLHSIQHDIAVLSAKMDSLTHDMQNKMSTINTDITRMHSRLDSTYGQLNNILNKVHDLKTA